MAEKWGLAGRELAVSRRSPLRAVDGVREKPVDAAPVELAFQTLLERAEAVTSSSVVVVERHPIPTGVIRLVRPQDLRPMSLRHAAAQTIEKSSIRLNRDQKNQLINQLTQSAHRSQRYRPSLDIASIPNMSIPDPKELKRLTDQNTFEVLSRQFHRPISNKGNIAAATRQIVQAANENHLSDDFRYIDRRAQIHLRRDFDNLSSSEKLFFAGRYVCLAVMHAELFNERPFHDVPNKEEPVDSNLEAFLAAAVHREDLMIYPLLSDVKRLQQNLGLSLPYRSSQRRAGIEGNSTARLMQREGVLGFIDPETPDGVNYAPEELLRKNLDRYTLASIAYHENLHRVQWSAGKRLERPIEHHIAGNLPPTYVEALTDLETWLLPQLVNQPEEIRCTFPISSHAGAIELYRATLDLFDNVGADAFRSLLCSTRHGAVDGPAKFDEQTGKSQLPRIRELYDRHMGKGSFDARMKKHCDFVVTVGSRREYHPQLFEFPASLRPLPTELIPLSSTHQSLSDRSVRQQAGFP